MQKFFFALLLVAVCNAALAQETRTNRSGSTTRRGEAAGYASRDASALSMMGWGIALAVGIATLVSLLDNNSAHGGHSH